VTAPLIWLLAAVISVTSPHPWPGSSAIVATRPVKPIAHSAMTVAASGLPSGLTSASVLAGSQEQPMRRLSDAVYRATFLAPQAGPLTLAVHFWRRGRLYEVPGGTILVQPKQ
jgi:propanediol dehydratase small subunit